MYKYAKDKNNNIYEYTETNFESDNVSYKADYSNTVSLSTEEYSVSFEKIETNSKLDSLDFYSLTKADILKSIKNSIKTGAIVSLICLFVVIPLLMILDFSSFVKPITLDLFFPMFWFFSINLYFPIKLLLGLMDYFFHISKNNHLKISLVNIHFRGELETSKWFISRPSFETRPILFSLSILSAFAISSIISFVI